MTCHASFLNMLLTIQKAHNIGHNIAEHYRSLIAANALAHAREYLPLCSMDKAIFMQLREVQTRYEAEASLEEEEDEHSLAAAESAKKEILSAVEQAELQSMRQALAEYEEKHGMDHPTKDGMAAGAAAEGVRQGSHDDESCKGFVGVPWPCA